MLRLGDFQFEHVLQIMFLPGLNFKVLTVKCLNHAIIPNKFKFKRLIKFAHEERIEFSIRKMLKVLNSSSMGLIISILKRQNNFVICSLH